MQQRAGRVAGLAGGDQHLVGDRLDARLALDRLDQHRGGALPDRVAQRARSRRGRRRGTRPAAGRRGPRSGQPRASPRARRACGRGSRPRADDLRRLDAAAVGVLAGELDRALVRLGPGVGEEDPAAEARLGQALGEPAPSARCRRGWRRASGAPPARARPRPRRGWQCPTEQTEMPGEEVEVLPALGVPEPRALAADELDRRPRR